MATITAEHVTLAYKNKLALDDVSFTLRENTICGLLGRNGAGKTSLMSLISSFRPASSGTLLYDGQPLYDNEAIMPHISFIYQQNTESMNGRVRDFLTSASLFRPRWDEAYARKLLAEFNLSSKTPVASLSKGMQACLRGVIGLASQCEIELFDEAYLGMDAVVRKKFIQEILDNYLRRPHTILFSTHFISEVENMLEEVLVLQEGKVFLHENCDDLRSKGFTVTGEANRVDTFTSGLSLELLDTRTLGNQKEVVLFGQISEGQRSKAVAQGLSLSHPNLQDLFVHITALEAFPATTAPAA